MEYQSKNPHYRKTLIDKMQQNHFMQYIGLRDTRVEPGYMEAELLLETKHLQQNGYVHGGVISAVADIVMGFSAYAMVAEGEGTVTSDLKIAYLRPGIGSVLLAKGRVIKPGRMLYYCESDIICRSPEGEETLIARGYATMCVVRK